MAAERPRRFAALAAQAPASPAHGLKRAEAQIEQAAVERVNLSTYPKDHPIWQDLHFCPDGEFLKPDMIAFTLSTDPLEETAEAIKPSTPQLPPLPHSLDPGGLEIALAIIPPTG